MKKFMRSKQNTVYAQKEDSTGNSSTLEANKRRNWEDKKR